jgi:hypothetical protein
MSDRKSLKVQQETFERGKQLKESYETWDSFWQRAMDALEE